MMRRTSSSSIWKVIAPAGSSVRRPRPDVGVPVARDLVQVLPAISGCGMDQVTCTGTSSRSRSGISTVEPAG